MSARRNWYFSTVTIAALTLGLDAAAQRPEHVLQKIHDLKPAWAGPVFPGPNAGLVPGQSARGSTQPSLPGRGLSSGPLAPAPTAPDDRGSSISKGAPGHGGNMPDKSNKGGAHGKDKHDSPGENVQAIAGDMIPQSRPLHTIPTCQ